MGLSKLFEIQARAFDPILRGRSFVGRSRTGTGKTVAYLLPMLERMRQEKMTLPHAALVLVPSRELCKQVAGSVLQLAVTMDVALVYSGEQLASQEQFVRMGARVIVGTPGRCAQLLHKGAIDASNVRILVIDEADAMLSLEYIGRVERVLNAVAKPGLQTILMSASLPLDIRGVIDKHFRNYELVDLVDRGGAPGAAVVQKVAHLLCKVPRPLNTRTRVLLHFLSERLDLQPGKRCIIFVDSTNEAKALVSHPSLDRRAKALHSDSTSKDRDIVLTSFANREFDVLVATDIVARGVDFADVALVLQLHPPRDPAQYVHRAGRTGRAGQGGTSIVLYDGTEHRSIQRVRRLTQHQFQLEQPPGPDDLHRAALGRLLGEILSLQPAEYEPFLPDAERLLKEQGGTVMATAMAVLDRRHADLERANRQAPSLLTGRKGYICLMAHEVGGAALSEGDVRQSLTALLPPSAQADMTLGRVAKVTGGWVIDVAQRHASALVADHGSGKQSAPFELTVVKQLPRLARSSSSRMRRVPWRSMRRRAMEKARAENSRASRRSRGGAPDFTGAWPAADRGAKD